MKLQPPAAPPFLGPDILLSVLFPDALTLCSSLSGVNRVSRSYEANGEVLNIVVEWIALLLLSRDHPVSSLG